MDTMSRNTHPEVAPPVLYVPIDERVDGELGFSLAHMVDQTRVLLAYTSLDRLLNGYDNLGESAEEVTPTLPMSVDGGIATDIITDLMGTLDYAGSGYGVVTCAGILTSVFPVPRYRQIL